MKNLFLFIFVLLPMMISAQLRFEVSFSTPEPKLEGRLLLLISNNDKEEPRMQINDGHQTQLVFGLDLENYSSNSTKEINATNSLGFPIQSLSEVPSGTY